MAEKKKKIDPKKYADILSKTQLVEIYLDSCSVSHMREEIQTEKKIKIEIKDKASFKIVEDGFKAFHVYEAKAVSSNPEVLKPLMNINVVFCLVFRSHGDIGKDFFEVFKVVNLPLNSWPYLREFVQSMIQRMNLPHLTLPFAHTDK